MLLSQSKNRILKIEIHPHIPHKNNTDWKFETTVDRFIATNSRKCDTPFK